MDQEKFTTSQGRSMMILYILGVTLILLGYSGAKEDTWLACLISFPLALILALVYERILKLYDNKDIFQIINIVYGKFLGKLIILIYILVFTMLGALVLRNISEYIQVVSLPETPQYVTVIFIGILSIYAVQAGIEVLFRWAKFILPLIIIVTFISFILSIPNFNFTNIQPVLYRGWKPVLKSTFSILLFPFGEVLVFLPLFSSLKDKEDTGKIFFQSIFVAGFLIFLLTMRNILVLGIENIEITYFPSYYASSIIKIGNFIQRSEIIVSINLLLAGLSKFCVILLSLCISLNDFFKTKDYRKYSIYLFIIMGIISSFIYKNTIDMFNAMKIIPYISTPFLIIIPIITLVVGGIRKKLTTNN